MVDCPDCTTAEDFAAQFAGNYAANVALGKFTGAVLSTPIAQKVGRYMYQKFLSAGSAIVNSTKKSLIAITELKNKAAGYLDEVWGRVRGRLVKNESEKLIDNLLIAEMKNLGINFTEINLKFVAKNNDGLIMFLEKGNSSAGFQHILEGKWVGNPRFQLLFNNSEDKMIKNIVVSIKNSSYK